MQWTCADPESFVRGGPTLTTFFFLSFYFDEGGGSEYHYKRGIVGPPAKRHLVAFRWRVDDGPTLNAGLVAAIFQGIWICIARKPLYFCDFSGGVQSPSPPPSGSAHGGICLVSSPFIEKIQIVHNMSNIVLPELLYDLNEYPSSPEREQNAFL